MVDSTPYKVALVAGMLLGIFGIIILTGLTEIEQLLGIPALIIGIGVMIGVFPLLNYMVRRGKSKIVKGDIRYNPDEQFEPLLEWLKAEEDWKRREGAWTLGLVNEKRAVAPLIFALNDKHKMVREYAAWSLGRIGDEEAVDSLIIALTDSNKLVRKNAAWSLGEIGDTKAIEPLKTQLSKEKNKSLQEVIKLSINQLSKIEINNNQESDY